VLLFIVVALLLAGAIGVMPPARTQVAEGALPRWDIPARMGIATAFVLLLTGLAERLGAHLTGPLAPFPLYAALLAVFAHHLHRGDQAHDVLRGLLYGLFAFAGFFLALAALLPRLGPGLAFTAAVATAVSVQAATLWRLRPDRAASDR
jgi:hypothetical protein